MRKTESFTFTQTLMQYPRIATEAQLRGDEFIRMKGIRLIEDALVPPLKAFGSLGVFEADEKKLV